MFTVIGMRKLHSWTHSSLTLVLDHLATIPEGDYAKEVLGFGFPTLRAQIMHIFNCEGFWIHTLQGARFENEEPGDWPSVCMPEFYRVASARTRSHIFQG